MSRLKEIKDHLININQIQLVGPVVEINDGLGPTVFTFRIKLIDVSYDPYFSSKSEAETARKDLKSSW